MPIVIKIISPANMPWRIANDTYLETFDPEGNGGRGTFAFTALATKAKPFKSMSEALDYWRTQSATVPFRPDGKPNRPLTAFNVSLEEV
jgi:hypothetical protein